MSRKSIKEKKQKEQMRNIIISIAVVLIGLAVILIGVASMTGAGGHNHDHEAKITLKVALEAKEGDIHYKAVQDFKADVESASHGTIHVEINGSSKLGSSQTLLALMGQKESPADIVIADVADLTKMDARMDISTLPFLFKSHQDAYKFVDGDIQKQIEDTLQNKGIRVLAHYSDGFEYISTSRKMISDVYDLQGMNFALNKESYMMDALRLFEAHGQLVEFGKLQNVLERGECAGYVGTLEDIYDKQLYNMQGSMAVTYHSYHALVFAISESVWTAMSEEQRQVVTTAAIKSAQTDRALMEQYEFSAVKNIENTGVKVTYPNLKSFSSVVTASYNNYRSKYGNLIDAVLAEMKK